MLTEKSVEAAPVWAAKLVHAAALQAAQAASFPSLFIILLTFMAKTKIKMAVVTGLALLLATGMGLHLYNQHHDRLQQQAKSPLSTSPIGDRNPVAKAPQIRRLSKPETPSQQSPEILDAISNLRRVLRELPVDDQGRATTDGVEAGLRAFGPNIKAAIPTCSKV
jgi:hypothetical protein